MIQGLPNEILLEIFKNLTHTDLLKVSQVSKRFNESATDSSLWKRFDMNKRSLDEKIQLLNLPRFQKLKSLTLTTTTCYCNCGNAENLGKKENEILELLMGIDLEEIKLKRFNFESIDKELLADVICKTKNVKLNAHGDLELDKLNKIMAKIPGGKIENLVLEHVDFSGIEPQKVAKAINSLQVFCSDFCYFELSQIMETFEEMSLQTNLRNLFLHTDFLKNVPAKIISQALNKLELLCLVSKEDSLSSDQMMELFRAMAHQTSLQKLVLTLPDAREGSFTSVPADILTRAISKLDVFIAPRLRFSESQIKSVFQNIATNESSKTLHLNLGSWHEPQFSLVDLNTLRAVMNKIRNNDFKMLLQITNIERSITELKKLQEENDKMEEEGEEKLSDEEMTKRWFEVACEARRVRRSMPSSKCMMVHNIHRNLRRRLLTGIQVISQVRHLQIQAYLQKNSACEH